MPPISGPQSSRAGLITAVVVFVILFVASAIFAIYSNVQWTASEQRDKELRQRYSRVATEADLSNPSIASLGQGGGTAIQKIIQQRDAESKLITGNAAAASDQVPQDITTTVDAANVQLKGANVALTIPGDNLLGAIRGLSTQIVSLTQDVAKAQADAKAANDKANQTIAERDKVVGDKDKQIAAVRAELDAAKADIQKWQESKNANVTDIQANADKALKDAQAQTAAAQGEITKLQGINKSLESTVRSMTSKLSRLRIDPTKALQQADGAITRVQNGTVFINVGEGQGVSPGLTFEVYDKNKPLPPLTSPNGPDDAELPAGKASIEVVRVLPGSSECRVIKTALGQNLVIGDVIMNLVYDPHTKYNFVVYGNFDISSPGNPNSTDGDILRRLVSQWGGVNTTQVSADTDFVVLGKEPDVKALTPEEADNPSAVARHEEQQKALDNYLDVRAKAIQLGIPVLNQNRFLYFVGYYDQARR